MTSDAQRPRRRDPEAHRAAILEATREALAEHGYARTTIRDIARRAGVTHGLVMRHFGSKERLMVAAMPGPAQLDLVFDGDPAGLPERIAHGIVERLEHGVAEDPLVALIRSAATNETAARQLFAEVRRTSAVAWAKALPGVEVDVELDLVSATLIGFVFERYVLAQGTLAEMGAPQFERHLAGVLRHVLAPVLSAIALSPPQG